MLVSMKCFKTRETFIAGQSTANRSSNVIKLVEKRRGRYQHCIDPVIVNRVQSVRGI